MSSPLLILVGALTDRPCVHRSACSRGLAYFSSCFQWLWASVSLRALVLFPAAESWWMFTSTLFTPPSNRNWSGAGQTLRSIATSCSMLNGNRRQQAQVKIRARTNTLHCIDILIFRNKLSGKYSISTEKTERGSASSGELLKTLRWTHGRAMRPYRKALP